MPRSLPALSACHTLASISALDFLPGRERATAAGPAALHRRRRRGERERFSQWPPSASASARAPWNTSPAPSVSTAWTSNAGIRCRVAPSSHATPFAAQGHRERPGASRRASASPASRPSTPRQSASPSRAEHDMAGAAQRRLAASAARSDGRCRRPPARRARPPAPGQRRRRPASACRPAGRRTAERRLRRRRHVEQQPAVLMVEQQAFTIRRPPPPRRARSARPATCSTALRSTPVPASSASVKLPLASLADPAHQRRLAAELGRCDRRVAGHAAHHRVEALGDVLAGRPRHVVVAEDEIDDGDADAQDPCHGLPDRLRDCGSGRARSTRARPRPRTCGGRGTTCARDCRHCRPVLAQSPLARQADLYRPESIW